MFGYIPSTAAFLTADAGNLIFKAFESGALTRGAVREYIRSLNSPKTGFHGITGDLPISMKMGPVFGRSCSALSTRII